MSITRVVNGTTSIDFTVNSSQSGTVYYVLYKTSPTLSSPKDIKNDALSGITSNIIRNGFLKVNLGQENQDLIKLLTNLSDNNDYQLYSVFETNTGLNSNVQVFHITLGVRHLATSYISQISEQSGLSIRYWIYRPESYYKNTGTTYPVLMFYHGLGEMGSNDYDITRVLANGPPKIIKEGTEMEYIVVSPQAYNDASGPVRFSTPGWLDEVLEIVKSQNRVDTERVYLTGLSLGGRAVYYLAGNQPSKISALLPASGVFDSISEAQVFGIKDIPFWGFNNDNDPAVNYNTNLKKFINMVNACVPPPVVAPLTTIYSAWNHDSWTNMYNTPEVYTWLLSKTKSKPTNSVLNINIGGNIDVLSTTYNLNGIVKSLNGKIIFYEWTKRSGSDVTIINPNTINPILQDLKKGTYIFRLFATDDKGASGFADVTLNVNPSSDSQIPTAPSKLNSANQTTTSILLNWNSSTDNSGISSYNIYNETNLIDSVNGSTLSYNVIGLNPNTSYSFNIKALNSNGKISPASNILIISTKSLPLPTITTQPIDQNVVVGKTVIFNVSGTDISNYQWYKNGVNIINANSNSYTLNNVSLNDSSSKFICIVSNSTGSINSNEALLTVSPVIVSGTTTGATGTGLTARYYTNSTDFSNPVTLTRTDAVVDFDWGFGSPDPSISIDNFTAQWTGQLLANYSEEYTFYTTTDDGVRLWINGQLLIDKWNNQSSTEWSGKITLISSQKYDIKLQYFENGGTASCSLSWSSPSQIKQVIPTSQLFPENSKVIVGGTKGIVGITGKYHSNSTGLTTPADLTRIDSTINFDWGFGSPDPSISVNNFTAQWTGQLLANYSEEYTFYTSTDDGVRLWINGQLLIDKWIDESNTEWSGKITLVAGHKYNIKLQYYENQASANCSLSWSSPSQIKQVIPTSQYFI